ncbi:Hypothetical protein AA314_07040 [Archangium gephyra]|uniref:Uncharacterized protein n=1 Tax=Archangium gephyra TaxID=48 RepID=A0AAC8QDB4_9BACT|nr:Hypothetical protein AA314_07040 [Archangium gephyra]
MRGKASPTLGRLLSETPGRAARSTPGQAMVGHDPLLE